MREQNRAKDGPAGWEYAGTKIKCEV